MKLGTEMTRVSVALTIALCGVALATLAGCAHRPPPSALSLQPDSLRLRQLQTRRFDTSDEKFLLQSSLGVLQDLGFEVDESEARLGVLVASKHRDASDAAQIAGQIFLGALTGARMPIDQEQRIRASIVTRAVTPDATTVRITFQRVVWNDMGQVSRTESLDDPELYREFFFKLSKSVFLEAHGI
jgi:hypothetical protein